MSWPGQTAGRGALNIILVEDDDGDAKAVVRAFQKARVANPIIRVRDGVDALSLLRGETGSPPETYILLTDVNLPRMSGLELLPEIRRDARLARAVVFVMTTSDADRDKDLAHDGNVAGYILKSNAGADFLNLVRTLDQYWHIVEMPDMPARAEA